MINGEHQKTIRYHTYIKNMQSFYIISSVNLVNPVNPV